MVKDAWRGYCFSLPEHLPKGVGDVLAVGFAALIGVVVYFAVQFVIDVALFLCVGLAFVLSGATMVDGFDYLGEIASSTVNDAEVWDPASWYGGYLIVWYSVCMFLGASPHISPGD